MYICTYHYGRKIVSIIKCIQLAEFVASLELANIITTSSIMKFNQTGFFYQI